MITQFELLLTLSLAGYGGGKWPLPVDARYSTVSSEWMLEARAAWLRSLPDPLVTTRDLGGGKTERAVRWVPEAGDCDNIAADFIAYLNRCMWVDAVATGQPRGNIAAGSLYYHDTPGDATTGHAIVWWVDHEQLPHHMDPATGETDHLTPAQINTIFGGAYA